MNIEKREQLIKKLLYLSCNRGCKETDLIIGKFARKNIRNMSDNDLLIFSNIIHLQDVDIYDWYTKKKPLPKGNSSQIMTQLLNFDPNINND